MIARLTTSEFIEKAKLVHGDSYDYSQTNYVTSRIKLSIICPIHGVFYQKANGHLNGRGCDCCGPIKAGKSRRLLTSEFIEKAKLVHGDSYDYFKVTYATTHKKVKIICPIHGVFEQTPAMHLSGRGCKKCGLVNTIEKIRLSSAEFICKAQVKHGSRYDYSAVNYINSVTKVVIICSIHGSFDQSPDSHYRCGGCPKCGNIDRAKLLKKDIGEFVTYASKIHNYNYDYFDVEYINNNTEVSIWCHKHGVFNQKPKAHLHGSGCPNCATHGFNPSSSAVLYVLKCGGFLNNIECVGKSFLKVGITNNYKKRMQEIDNQIIDGITYNITNYLVRREIERGEDAQRLEDFILNKLKSNQYVELVNSEFSGKTELLNEKCCDNLLELSGIMISNIR